MTVRILNSAVRIGFEDAVQDRNNAVDERIARRVLGIAYGDRRLRRNIIRSKSDLENHLAVLNENLKDVQLSQFNIDDPDVLREAVILLVAREYLEQLGDRLNTATSVEDLKLPEDISASSLSESELGEERSDQLSDKKSAELAGSDQSDNDSSAESSLADAEEALQEPTAASLSSAEKKQVANESSLSTETGSEIATDVSESASDVDDTHEIVTSTEEEEPPRWEDLDIDIPQADDDIELESFGDDVLAAINRWDPEDIDFLCEHSGGLRDLILEGNSDQVRVGITAFLRLSFERPEEIIPNLDTLIGEFVGMSEPTLSKYATLIANLVVREHPSALVGHIDDLFTVLERDFESVKWIALDTIERFTREHREQIKSEHLIEISKGLNDESVGVRADAAVTLARTALDRAEDVIPYVGALVEQSQYNDESGMVALHALRRVSGEQPSALVPYTDQLLSLYDDLDAYLLWMDTLVPLVGEASQISKNVDKFVDLLGAEDLAEANSDAREAAATLLYRISSESPEALIPYLDDLDSHIDDNPEIASYIILAFRNVGAYNSSHVVSRLDRIVSQFGGVDQVDYSIVRVLGTVSDEAPQEVAPYVDDIAQALSVEPTEDEDRSIRDGVAYTLGHVAQSEPMAVRDYASEGLRLALDEESDVARAGVDIAKAVADVDPALVEPFVDEIINALLEYEQNPSDSEEYVGGRLGECLVRIAEDSPTTITPYFQDLLRVAKRHQNTIGTKATHVVAYVASEEPEPVVTHIDNLLELMRYDYAPIVAGAAHTVGSVAQESPKQVVDVAGNITWLFEEEEEAAALAPLNLYSALLPEYSDIVSDALEYVVEAADSRKENISGPALDVLEQYARERPEDLVPYGEQVASHLNSRHEEHNRDAALILRHIAEEEPKAVKPYIPDIISLLTIDDQPKSVLSACICLAECAREYPNEVAAATELLISLVDNGNVQAELKLAAFRPLAQICFNNPSHLSNYTSIISNQLASDDSEVRVEAAELLTIVARSDWEAVTPELDELVAILREGDRPYAITTLLRSVASEDQSAVAEHTDLIFDMLRDFPRDIGDGTDPVPKLLVVAGFIAGDSPGEILEDLDIIEPYLQPSASSERRATALVVLGALSSEHPDAVKPYLDLVAAALEDEPVGGVYPAVDVINNVARSDLKAVEEYAPIINEVTHDDEEIQELIEETRALLRGEDIEAGDDDDPTLPYEKAVYESYEPEAEEVLEDKSETNV